MIALLYLPFLTSFKASNENFDYWQYLCFHEILNIIFYKTTQNSLSSAMAIATIGISSSKQRKASVNQKNDSSSANPLEMEDYEMGRMQKYILARNCIITAIMMISLLIGLGLINQQWRESSPLSEISSTEFNIENTGDRYQATYSHAFKIIENICQTQKFIAQKLQARQTATSKEVSADVEKLMIPVFYVQVEICLNSSASAKVVSSRQNIPAQRFMTLERAVETDVFGGNQEIIDGFLLCQSSYTTLENDRLENASLLCGVYLNDFQHEGNQGKLNLIAQNIVVLKYMEYLRRLFALEENLEIDRYYFSKFDENKWKNQLLLVKKLSETNLILANIKMRNLQTEICRTKSIHFGYTVSQILYPIHHQISTNESNAGPALIVTVRHPDGSSAELLKFTIVQTYYNRFQGEVLQLGDVQDQKQADNIIYKLVNMLPVLLPLLPFLWYVFFRDKPIVQQYIYQQFFRVRLLNQLYKNTITEIFSFAKNTPSNVLQAGPLSHMFAFLSEITHKNITPIQKEQELEPHRENFKFLPKTRAIIQKYRHSVSKLMHGKNKSILNNRFNIQSYVNQLCEEENKKMKTYYLRTQEMHIEREFFLFAYMAVLKSPEKFGGFVKEDEHPFPEELAEYFMRMNQLMHQTQIVRERIEEQQKIQIAGDNMLSSHKSNGNPTADLKKSQQTSNKANQAEFLKNPMGSGQRNKAVVKKNSEIEERKSPDQQEEEEKKEPMKFVKNVLINITRKRLRQTREKEAEEENMKMQALFLEENRDQIQIRIRVHLIPKYLAMLRDLDIQNHYAQELNLEREIWSLTEIVENTRYLLTRHNKNIRLFSTVEAEERGNFARKA